MSNLTDPAPTLHPYAPQPGWIGPPSMKPLCSVPGCKRPWFDAIHTKQEKPS